MLRIRILILLVCIVPLVSYGSAFTVDSTTDSPDAVPGDGACAAVSGGCTLRAAIMEANALVGADTIELPAGNYALTIPGSTSFETDDFEGDLNINDHLIVTGAGREDTIVRTSLTAHRVVSADGARFNPDPLQVTLVGMTLTEGTSTLGGCVRNNGNGTLRLESMRVTQCGTPDSTGGGIYHGGSGQVGFLEVVDSEVTENRGNPGGGINTGNGTLTVERSLIARNVAIGPDPFNSNAGGAIYMPLKVATIVDSALIDNTAGRKGGAIFASQGQITIERTTISGNEVTNTTGLNDFGEGSGGGIYIERVSMTITNSTFSHNIAPNEGAGFYVQRRGDLQMMFNTFTGNDSTAGVSGGNAFHVLGTAPFTSDVTMKGNIFASNALTSGTECAFEATVTSLGYNLDSDSSCLFMDPTDLPGTDPMLAALTNNGGLGGTHDLLAGSPAIDAVPVVECALAIDGRGGARPVGAGCDIGAVETVGQAATPEEQIDDLGDVIAGLVDLGVLKKGNGKALQSKLDSALAKLAKGKEAAAINVLNAFINQVNALINSGKLTASEGQVLIDAANAIIDAITG